MSFDLFLWSQDFHRIFGVLVIQFLMFDRRQKDGWITLLLCWSHKSLWNCVTSWIKVPRYTCILSSWVQTGRVLSETSQTLINMLKTSQTGRVLLKTSWTLINMPKTSGNFISTSTNSTLWISWCGFNTNDFLSWITKCKPKAVKLVSSSKRNI